LEDEIAELSSKVTTEGLKLTIFTYKWGGECVKSVGEYFLESFI